MYSGMPNAPPDFCGMAGAFLEEFSRIIGFDWQLVHDMVLTGINVFILFFILSYFLFNPVQEFLEKRRQKIAGQLAEAADNQRAGRELKEEYEKRLREIQKEADAILTEAGKKARIREARILEEARREAAGILKRADREMELEKQKAMDEMKQEMISIASLMAGRAVAAAMNTEAQNRLIEETLKEIDESTWEL